MIPVSTLVPGAVAEVVRKAPLTPEKVAFAWRLAVGPAVDKATRVRLAEDGTLHVEADSQAWIDSIRSSIGVVRSRLAHFLGETTISRVHFTNDPR